MPVKRRMPVENKTGYLKQDGTGNIFVWTPQLAIRDDMRPCPPPKGTKTAESDAPAKAPAKEPSAPEPENLDPNRAKVIGEAMLKVISDGSSSDIDGETGRPKLDAIKKASGLEDITEEEASEVWSGMNMD